VPIFTRYTLADLTPKYPTLATSSPGRRTCRRQLVPTEAAEEDVPTERDVEDVPTEAAEEDVPTEAAEKETYYTNLFRRISGEEGVIFRRRRRNRPRLPSRKRRRMRRECGAAGHSGLRV
jgi:hypothetical protein